MPLFQNVGWTVTCSEDFYLFSCILEATCASIPRLNAKGCVARKEPPMNMPSSCFGTMLAARKQIVEQWIAECHSNL